MREGYWINYRTNKEFPTEEHERWVREEKNAKKLGLSRAVIDKFVSFEPVKDRNELILYIVSNAPVMRVRGHGNYVTFEFSTRSRKRAALDAIWTHLMGKAGPFTGMRIVNFATHDTIEMLYKDFEERMEQDDYEAVLRRATKIELKPKHQALVSALAELVVDGDDVAE